MFSFFIPGKPQGKERHRYNRRTKVTYTPKNTKEYERLVRLSFINKYPAFKVIEADVPVRVSIIAQYKIPKSMSKTKKTLIADGNVYPLVKPDCDNVGKAIMDALNGYAYCDDKQVVSCLIDKRYALCDEDVGCRVIIEGLDLRL